MKEKERKTIKKESLPVRVSICSHICDMTTAAEFSESREFIEMMKNSIEDNEEIDRMTAELDREADGALNSTIEYITDGSLDDNGKDLSVSYEESEDTGMGGTVTTLHTSYDRPQIVTMTRSGSLTSCITFNSENRRQICTYGTEFMPMQFAVYTRRIDNTLGADGGSLFIDYDIEMNGVCTERSRLTIDVTPQ